MTSIPFSQYFKRGEMVDVSEYLRCHATHESVLIIKIGKPNENYECKCFSKIKLFSDREEDIPVIYPSECTDIIYIYLKHYREFFNEIQATIKDIIKLSASSSFIIEIDLPQKHFVKHPEQLKVTYVQSLHQTQDSDPRSSNILGALRWGLEKYVILKIATLDPSGFGDFMEAWLTSRGVEVKGSRHQIELKRFAMYYPPNVVFGASGVGEAQRSGERVSPVRGAVSVTRLEGHNGFVKLEFSLDPPPITYRILGELGVAPRDVKKALVSFLAVAAAMLSPSKTFGGQAPVPLTTNLKDSGCQQACVETPYEVDLNLVDCIIESFWCKVKSI
jgi:hypothetical protein